MSEEPKPKQVKPHLYDLLQCAGLLIVGGTSLSASMAASPVLALQLPQWLLLPLFTMIALSSFIAIGAGLGAPFKRKLLGAAMGLLFFGIFMTLIYLPEPAVSRIRRSTP